jgi:hypothetical protein
MQRYTVYFIWKLLYMFQVVPPPIIRRANNCIYSIWYLSDRYCYLPLYILSGNCSTCFGWYFHPSSGAQTTASTASGICQTVTAIWRYIFYLETVLHVSGATTTHHQERKQLYLQHLVLVTPLLLPAAVAADSSNGVKNTRCCRYSCLSSWWWVVVPPEICRTVSR